MSLMKTLFGLGVTAALADRENFVKQVSGVVQQYQEDPAKSEKLAGAAASFLERMRDKINLESAIQEAVGAPLSDNSKQMEELTTAIKELTLQIQQGKNG